VRLPTKASGSRTRKDGTTLAIEDYLMEEDPWKEFLVLGVGYGSDKADTVAQCSKKWDDALANIPPKQSSARSNLL